MSKTEHLYPREMVVGALDGSCEPAAISAALADAGFGEDAVVVLYGERDADELDAAGESHGARGHLVRKLQESFSSDAAAIERHAQRLRDGNYVVGVSAGNDDDRYEAARVLHSLGGHGVAYFGKAYVESIAP